MYLKIVRNIIYHCPIISSSLYVWSWWHLLGDIASATCIWDWRIPWRGGGGWENIFPGDWINNPIQEGDRACPNGAMIHIYVLSLCFNSNRNKYLFLRVYLDVVFLPMRCSAQYLIAIRIIQRESRYISTPWVGMPMQNFLITYDISRSAMAV